MVRLSVDEAVGLKTVNPGLGESLGLSRDGAVEEGDFHGGDRIEAPIGGVLAEIVPDIRQKTNDSLDSCGEMATLGVC
jgi:hypothetical protein